MSDQKDSIPPVANEAPSQEIGGLKGMYFRQVKEYFNWTPTVVLDKETYDRVMNHYFGERKE